MSRGLTTALKDALAADIVRPLFLTEIETADTPLRLSSSSHNISWNASTWLGNGMLDSDLAGLNESQGNELPSLEVRLNAYDQALISTLFALTQKMYCAVYIGALDSSGAVIADPELIFKGKLETVEFTDSSQTLEAAVKYTNELAEFRRIDEVRWTHESQQLLFPGDNGFKYVAKSEDKRIFWGTAPQVKRIRKRRVGRN